MLDGLVDVYLPDMKYMDVDTAAKYSHAPDYPVVAKAAIAEMVRQCGEVVLDAEDAYIRRGVIVRHMLLPKHLLEAEKIIRYLYDFFFFHLIVKHFSIYSFVIK
jgi:putative pyruvate formate lyase activating enzyme